MIKLHKKLASRRGSSMILALVAMAICITVGASILMSASAAADTMKNRKADEKARLLVTSAAGILQKKVEQTVLEVKRPNLIGCETCLISYDRTATYEVSTDGVLQKAVRAATFAALPGDFSPSDSNKTTTPVSFTVQYGADSKDAVSCTFTVFRTFVTFDGETTNNYTADLTLSSADGRYSTTLHFIGTLIGPETALDNEVTVCAHGKQVQEQDQTLTLRWVCSNVS